MTQQGLQQLAGVSEGEILAGKYRVERVLGAGGMGAVVAAHHLQLDRKVAIKFLLPTMLANGDAVERFAREARNAVRITSEHVARVLDVGSLENGAPYMVMEYLEGSDLSAILRQRGPLPVEDAVDFVLQAMEAIAEAHTLGIVHRDLKPANLFCGRGANRRAHIKVLDFGISKGGASAGAGALTATTATMGSPFYMSPEQMESAQGVDARTDIWALGVIVFELVAGKVPFFGETIPEVSIKIGTRPPTPLRSLRPDAPEGLERVLLMSLEKDRERRPQSVAEMAAALLPFGSVRARASVERIADTMQIDMRTATVLAEQASPLAFPAATAEARVETMSALGQTNRAAPAGKVMIGLSMGIGVLLLAGGAVVLRSRFADRGVASPSAPLRSGPASGEALFPSPGIAAKVEPERAVDSIAASSASAAVAIAVAVCAPDSKRCSGATPQTCSAGQWQDGAPCPGAQRCHDGSCLDTQLTHPVAPRGPARRDGGAIIAGPSAKPDCDPNYFLDALGHKRFKPECFGIAGP